MVYAYDSQGPLPDHRTAEELYHARERVIARIRAAYSQYVIVTTEGWWEVQAIDMERRRRGIAGMQAIEDMPTARFEGAMKPAPVAVRPHVHETRPAHLERNGRMRLGDLDG